MTLLSIFLAAVFLGIESFFHNRAPEPKSGYNIAYNNFSSLCNTVCGNRFSMSLLIAR